MTHKHWKTTDEFPGSISLPYGVKTSHTWHEVGQILRIINDYDVYTFVELGCHVGGLASILHWRSRFRPFRYLGYDRDVSVVDDNVFTMAAIFQKDVFENPRELIPKDNDGRIFIYCDNGDKIREMKIYAPLLRSGDIIACHDYFDGQEVFGLKDFGFSDECGCKPEVRFDDLKYLFDDETFLQLPEYLLNGTRIIGFVKQ